MQAQTNAGMAPQTFKEGQIAALVSLLQYSIEIADRLVCVNQEYEAKLAQLNPTTLGLAMILRLPNDATSQVTSFSASKLSV